MIQGISMGLFVMSLILPHVPLHFDSAATMGFFQSLRSKWTRWVSQSVKATAVPQTRSLAKPANHEVNISLSNQLQKLRQDVEHLSKSMGQVETWKTQLHDIQFSLSNLNAKDVGNDVGKDPEKIETISDVPVNDDGKKSDTDKGPDKNTEKVNVFINGDAMPGRRVVPWLKTMHAEYPDLKVYKAVGTHTDVDLAKRKLAESGIPETQITVVQAKTTSANAADAVLTVLFGRHAQAGGLNYVLSDDKQWFGELPFMEISPGITTVWMRFSELKNPKFPMSREERQLCQMLLEYCRSKSLRGGTRQIREVYLGKRFSKYVQNKNASLKPPVKPPCLLSVAEKEGVGKVIAQVQADLNAKSNGSPPPPWVNIASGLAWTCTCCPSFLLSFFKHKFLLKSDI